MTFRKEVMVKIPDIHPDVLCLSVYVSSYLQNEFSFWVRSWYVMRWNDDGLFSHLITVTRVPHTYKINGEATSLAASLLPPLEGMLFNKTQIQATLLRYHVKKVGKILIVDNGKPLWTAGWVLCLCWENKSYGSNQDLLQLPALFLNLQHK